MKIKSCLRLVGRREFVDFPEFQLCNLEAKIDTGAYTSVLHCHDIEERVKEGSKHLFFKLLDPFHPEYNTQEHSTSEFLRKVVRNSFGEQEERFVIKTLIRIGKKKVRSSVALTDRGNMRYPVLLGRKFLKKSFLVDVCQVHLGGLALSENSDYLRNLKNNQT